MVSTAFFRVNGVSRRGIARVLSDGTLDDFMSDAGIGGGYVSAITFDRESRILIGGSFTKVGALDRG